MKRVPAAITLAIGFMVLASRSALAVGWGHRPGEEYPDLDHLVCSPPVEAGIAARLYSYEIPVVIRNEVFQEQSDIWAYAHGCVRAPHYWTPGQEVNAALREGQTWGSFGIYDSPPADAWQATFPPDEATRGTYDADNLSPLGPAKIYIPAFGPDVGGSPAVRLVEAPTIVPVGVSREMAETLRDAGIIVEDRVWSGYSTIPKAREGRNLKPYKVMARWLPASQLLCDPATHEKRPGSDADVARTLMVRDPAFPWDLAGEFDCRELNDKDQDGRRKWGGGIVVYHLFPNVEVEPLEVEPGAGTVQVTVGLKNSSAAAGPVRLYYRWDRTGVWEEYEETAQIQAYQNTSRGEMVGPFVMSLAGPERVDTLTVLAWPEPETGMTVSGPDLELVTGEVLQERAGLDRVFETYSRERTLQDNRQSAEVQPTVCGDLTVSVSAPSRASGDGFPFTATAHRDGCEELDKVLIETAVNGIAYRQEAAFHGQTATATFESGPQYGEPQVVLEVMVDPEDEVGESDETNNQVSREVLLHEEAFETITCPSGEPPEKCFRSRLTD